MSTGGVGGVAGSWPGRATARASQWLGGSAARRPRLSGLCGSAARRPGGRAAAPGWDRFARVNVIHIPGAGGATSRRCSSGRRSPGSFDVPAGPARVRLIHSPANVGRNPPRIVPCEPDDVVLVPGAGPCRGRSPGSVNGIPTDASDASRLVTRRGETGPWRRKPARNGGSERGAKTAWRRRCGSPACGPPAPPADGRRRRPRTIWP